MKIVIFWLYLVEDLPIASKLRSRHAYIRPTTAKCPFLSPNFWSNFESLRVCMTMDQCVERPLFGGAISSSFPLRFQDVSDIRQVPDHQEVFVDPSRDKSLIIELLDFKHDVGDGASASWFLNDLAAEQNAEDISVMEQSGFFEANGFRYSSMPAVITTAVGQMSVSKVRQGREAQNLVKVYLANLRLKGVDIDVLITAYEPIAIRFLALFTKKRTCNIIWNTVETSLSDSPLWWSICSSLLLVS